MLRNRKGTQHPAFDQGVGAGCARDLRPRRTSSTDVGAAGGKEPETRKKAKKKKRETGLTLDGPVDGAQKRRLVRREAEARDDDLPLVAELQIAKHSKKKGRCVSGTSDEPERSNEAAAARGEEGGAHRVRDIAVENTNTGRREHRAGQKPRGWCLALTRSRT